MNILPALQHHLHNTHAYKWEYHHHTNSLQTTIQTPTQHTGPYQLHHNTTITITQDNDTLYITQKTGRLHQQKTINLLDPEFLDKIHKTILKEIHTILNPRKKK